MESTTAPVLQVQSIKHTFATDKKVRYLKEEYIDFLKLRRATLLLDTLLENLAEKGITQQQIEDLTPQEKTIIEHIANGFQTKEIAARLYISKHTVQTHRKNIYRKLNDCSTTDLVKVSLLL